MERPRNRDRVRAEAIRALCGDDAVVYACRLPDETIKIGFSTDLAGRRRCIAPGAEVLGFMPGNYADEQAIHEALAEHRAHGREYYYPTSAVLDVVNGMRERFNLPHIAA